MTSTTVSSRSETASPTIPLAYVGSATRGRDLRIDFLRGFAMIIMVVAHIEVFSVFNLFTSERLGLISGAEGFVLFSGFVLGQVYRPRVRIDGWITSIYRLWSRAWKLYVVGMMIVILIWVLSCLPWINGHEVMSFTDRGAGHVYPLYPTGAFDLTDALNRLFFMQAGPHQTQVLSLYVFLLMLTPVAFATFYRRWHWAFLGCSWLVYGVYQYTHYRLVNTQAEYAFPLMAWQVLFFNGMAVGWFRHELSTYVQGIWRTMVLGFCFTVTAVMFFIAQNHTNPFLPSWAHVRILPAETFNFIYNHYAVKAQLGPVRLLNDIGLYVTLYWLLTVCWRPLYRALGWFLIPVGQASLYVFIVHVFVVLLAAQLVAFSLTPIHWVTGTLIHAGALMFLWWMTTRKILTNIIPN
ncbi:MAG: hypothetical protein RLY58_983 [Pseudomonadota bacterium]|jgi:hypothetical protein